MRKEKDNQEILAHNRLMLILGIVIFTLTFASCTNKNPSKPLRTETTSEKEIPAKPGSDYVWVEPYTTDGKFRVRIPGFWRPKTKEGFEWVAGKVVMDIWVPGYWQPVGKAPDGKIWVNGHVSKEGQWEEGFWRDAVKPGYVWVRGGYYQKDGTWVEGYWKSE